MPAWGTGAEGGALLNQEQIYELVEMIHTVDWNLVYNDVIEANHGVYPPGPTAVPTDDTAEEGGAAEQAAASEGGGESVATLIAFDIGWELDGERRDAAEIVLTAASGDTITVDNTGASLHDFVVDELGIDADARRVNR